MDTHLSVEVDEENSEIQWPISWRMKGIDEVYEARKRIWGDLAKHTVESRCLKHL